MVDKLGPIVRLRLSLLILILLTGAACTSPSAPTQTPQANPLSRTLSLPRTPAFVEPTQTSTSSAPAPAFTPVSTSNPNNTPSTSPTLRPLNLNNPRTVVLAEKLPGPDDLVLAPDGSLYLSDVSDGTVKQVLPDGSIRTILSELSAPEGMVVLPDGSLIIAEQGKNQLIRYDPKTQGTAVFLTLRNKTGQLGVDGIALDTHNPGSPTIIIPDSPNGVVRRASLDGKLAAGVISGFARPTGAWVELDGSLLIVDENSGELVRIHPKGRLEKLAMLPTPDDAVEDEAGNIYVVTLGDNAVHVISAGTSQDILLVKDLAGPQGIAFDLDGNLVVTDPGNHRLVKIIIREP